MSRWLVSRRPALGTAASARLLESESHQPSSLAQRTGQVAHTHSAVVRRTLGVPCLDEAARAERESVSAVGVANFENRPSLGFALGGDQLEARLRIFDNREQRDRPANWLP